jgi:ribose 1,5-bisphosphokinase
VVAKTKSTRLNPSFAANPKNQSNPIMPTGTLFYVIGPSGSGKDSLMTYAREQINGQQPVLFAHRYITRPMDAGGENHVCLTHVEFAQRKALGLFALDWQSHQNCYGIGSEVITWLNTGQNVVVNGSREYLPTATQRFPDMRVILIEVSPDVLRHRLIARARIDRSRQIDPIVHPKLLILSNDTPLVESGRKFIDLLNQ